MTKQGSNKKVSEELMNFINSISNVGGSNIPNDDGKIYYSKVDGSYLTRVGMEEELEYLLKLGITCEIQDGYGEPKTACIGFNPTSKKWYGWSHRAIYGFGIGSECKKGNAGFYPSNKQEFIDREVEFWGDFEYAINGEINYTEVKGGIEITYTYNDEVPNENLRGTKYSHFSAYPKQWGRGEWKAETIEDAKQMAIDFAKSVS